MGTVADAYAGVGRLKAEARMQQEPGSKVKRTK
jgi:hypothetical protein